MRNDDNAGNFDSCYGKLFYFRIESATHIMDLIIEPPSALPSVCFQVHKMQDDSAVLFWNFGLTNIQKMNLVFQYVNEHPENFPEGMKTKMLDAERIACRDEKFIETLKLRAPIQRHRLSSDELKLVDAVANADLKLPENYHGGLDGHSYKLKIYSEPVKEFNFWCYIPKCWVEIPPLVKFFVEVAHLPCKDYYEISGFARR